MRVHLPRNTININDAVHHMFAFIFALNVSLYPIKLQALAVCPNNVHTFRLK